MTISPAPASIPTSSLAPPLAASPAPSIGSTNTPAPPPILAPPHILAPPPPHHVSEPHQRQQLLPGLLHLHRGADPLRRRPGTVVLLHPPHHGRLLRCVTGLRAHRLAPAPGTTPTPAPGTTPSRHPRGIPSPVPASPPSGSTCTGRGRPARSRGPSRRAGSCGVGVRQGGGTPPTAVRGVPGARGRRAARGLRRAWRRPGQRSPRGGWGHRPGELLITAQLDPEMDSKGSVAVARQGCQGRQCPTAPSTINRVRWALRWGEDYGCPAALAPAPALAQPQECCPGHQAASTCGTGCPTRSRTGMPSPIAAAAQGDWGLRGRLAAIVCAELRGITQSGTRDPPAGSAGPALAEPL